MNGDVSTDEIILHGIIWAQLCFNVLTFYNSFQEVQRMKKANIQGLQNDAVVSVPKPSTLTNVENHCFFCFFSKRIHYIVIVLFFLAKYLTPETPNQKQKTFLFYVVFWMGH